MDFRFSEEQQLLRDSVQKFIANDYDFSRRRRIVEGETSYSDEVWQLFADLGWLGLAFDEQYGGINGSAIETMIIMEEFGKGLVVEPYLATVVLCGGLLQAAASTGQRQTLLPAISAGELQLAAAFAEPQSRFNLANVATTATPGADGHYELNGAKAVVSNGPAADRLIVSARTNGAVSDRDGITLFLVDSNADGLSRRDYRTVDGMSAAEFQLQSVVVGPEAVIAQVGDGYTVLEQAIDNATVAMGAEAVGIMEYLYRSTVEYCKTREQFGQPIANFQVLQHRMVDMFMETEQCRSLLYTAVLSLTAGAGERRRAVSALKAKVGEAGRYIGQQAIQLHGGMGMTDEMAVGHYFKRLTIIDMTFGNADYHLRRFGDPI